MAKETYDELLDRYEDRLADIDELELKIEKLETRNKELTEGIENVLTELNKINL